jgi:hypothetical protein
MTTPNRHPVSGRFTEGPRADAAGVVHHPGGGGHTDARLVPGYQPPGDQRAQPCQYDLQSGLTEPPGMESASWDGLPSAEVVA